MDESCNLVLHALHAITVMRFESTPPNQRLVSEVARPLQDAASIDDEHLLGVLAHSPFFQPGRVILLREVDHLEEIG